MGLFTREVRGGGAGESAALSILGPGIELTGNLRVTGIVRIEGVIDGSVSGCGQVLIGGSGEVRGDVHAATILVAGRLRGDAVATGSVSVGARASVEGNIRTPSLKVEEGAVLRGRIDVAAAAGEAAQEPRLVHGHAAAARPGLIAVPA